MYCRYIQVKGNRSTGTGTCTLYVSPQTTVVVKVAKGKKNILVPVAVFAFVFHIAMYDEQYGTVIVPVCCYQHLLAKYTTIEQYGLFYCEVRGASVGAFHTRFTKVCACDPIATNFSIVSSINDARY